MGWCIKTNTRDNKLVVMSAKGRENMAETETKKAGSKIIRTKGMVEQQYLLVQWIRAWENSMLNTKGKEDNFLQTPEYMERENFVKQ